MFPELNIPIDEPLELIQKEDKILIKDPVRNKTLVLTPEEWVRQHLLHFLISSLGYPKSLIRTESGLNRGKKLLRSDILVHDRAGSPLVLVECKSFSVKINKEVLYQAVSYNETIKAKCIILSNGMMHYCLMLNLEKQKFEQVFAIPEYKELSVYQ